MCRATALALFLLPCLAVAQEARKFNAKQLEEEFAAVGVFAPKGVAIVDNEVMLALEPGRDFVQAVYVARVDLKKVLGFYKGKTRVEPKTEGEEELGTQRYSFAPVPLAADKRLYKVTVEPSERKGQVIITLMHRAITDGDPVAGGDE